MSNDINVPRQKPILTEAQNILKDGGGGGNLGYFQGNRKKKEQQETFENIFEEEEGDMFIPSSSKEQEVLLPDSCDTYVHETEKEDDSFDYVNKAKKLLNNLNFFKKQ